MQVEWVVGVFVTELNPLFSKYIKVYCIPNVIIFSYCDDDSNNTFWNVFFKKKLCVCIYWGEFTLNWTHMSWMDPSKYFFFLCQRYFPQGSDCILFIYSIIFNWRIWANLLWNHNCVNPNFILTAFLWWSKKIAKGLS